MRILDSSTEEGAYNYNWDNPGQPEWLYLAGFFEADGCISASQMRRDQKMPQLMISIGNDDERILRIALKAFGCGRLDTNMWCLGGHQQVAEALRCLRPYLVLKAEQVDVALEITQRPRMDSGVSREKRQKEYAFRFELQEKLAALKVRTNYKGPTEKQRADALWLRSK